MTSDPDGQLKTIGCIFYFKVHTNIKIIYSKTFYRTIKKLPSLKKKRRREVISLGIFYSDFLEYFW